MDLKDYAADVAPKLPAPEDDDWFVLSTDVLPKPPLELEASGLVARHTTANYHLSYPVPKVELFADKGTFRSLGLLILATVLHAEPKEVRVRLTRTLDPHRAIQAGGGSLQHILIEFEHRSEAPLGALLQKPEAFSYAPDVAAKHPWYRDLPPDVYDLPSASITDLEKMNMPGEERPLDTVYGFGNARGSVAFAELLLNVSLESAQLDEYVLESEIGFRGVAPGSAEIALWLPGSIGYDCFVGPDENP